MGPALVATNQATCQETVVRVRETPEVEIRGGKIILVEETMAKDFLGTKKDNWTCFQFERKPFGLA